MEDINFIKRTRKGDEIDWYLVEDSGMTSSVLTLLDKMGEIVVTSVGIPTSWTAENIRRLAILYLVAAEEMKVGSGDR